MTLQDVLEAQIDAAIRGLMHARAGLGDPHETEPQEISRQLETVSYHLQDIQYNWLSLTQLPRDDLKLAVGITH